MRRRVLLDRPNYDPMAAESRAQRCYTCGFAFWSTCSGCPSCKSGDTSELLVANVIVARQEVRDKHPELRGVHYG